MTSAAAAIRADGLTKYFGSVVGIEDLSFAVEQGEIYGFLGANGAGKTTTIRVLLDLIRPTKGSASPMRTPLLISKIEVRRKDGKAAKFGLDLVRLDTDHWKSWVHERLRWPDDHIGGWHVFKGVDDDYCHQLVSEARLKQPTGRVEWVQRSRDNHFFDCEAMQAAAGYLLNVQRIPLQKLKDGTTGGVGRKPPTPSEVSAPLNAPPVPPPPTRSRKVRRIVRSSYLGA